MAKLSAEQKIWKVAVGKSKEELRPYPENVKFKQLTVQYR